jgi:hypothetical protein
VLTPEQASCSLTFLKARKKIRPKSSTIYWNQSKLEMTDARNKVKIDRSHRIGKRKAGNQKPRPIVAKFNYYQDREFVRINAKKLKGTKIGILEQFPEEIESVHRALYSELQKAKEEGKKAKIIKDKLIIEGRVFPQQR